MVIVSSLWLPFVALIGCVESAAKATAEEHVDEVTLFVAVKTGPGLKNVRYRASARRTWLDLSMDELPAGGFNGSLASCWFEKLRAPSSHSLDVP